MQPPLRLQAMKAALARGVSVWCSALSHVPTIPEAADADGAAAKGEIVNPCDSGVAQAGAGRVHVEGGGNVALHL